MIIVNTNSMIIVNTNSMIKVNTNSMILENTNSMIRYISNYTKYDSSYTVGASAHNIPPFLKIEDASIY